jgi:hypothetical protein
MTKIENGGPAFPCSASETATIPSSNGQTGMDLRDWFAGQALAGLALAMCIAKAELLAPEQTSVIAYQLADQMLKARE